MPVFETPASIDVTLDLSVGHVRIAASDRTDTVVEVRPSNAADEADVKAAQQVRVDYANGMLRVTGPRRTFDFSRKAKSVDVTIELPSGFRIGSDLQAGDIRCTGTLGSCQFKTSAGNVAVERTGALRVTASAGQIVVGSADGDAEFSTGSGKVQIGEITGTAQVKNSNGDTTIGSVTGDVRVRAANGDIVIERAGAGVDAKTSNGSVRLAEVVRGAVTVGTAMGNLEVGVAEGTAAWLEITTAFGSVRNELASTAQPGAAQQTVEVRGRTAYGDVIIRRA